MIGDWWECECPREEIGGLLLQPFDMNTGKGGLLDCIGSQCREGGEGEYTRSRLCGSCANHNHFVTDEG